MADMPRMVFLSITLVSPFFGEYKNTSSKTHLHFNLQQISKVIFFYMEDDFSEFFKLAGKWLRSGLKS